MSAGTSTVELTGVDRRRQGITNAPRPTARDSPGHSRKAGMHALTTSRRASRLPRRGPLASHTELVTSARTLRRGSAGRLSPSSRPPAGTNPDIIRIRDRTTAHGMRRTDTVMMASGKSAKKRRTPAPVVTPAAGPALAHDRRGGRRRRPGRRHLRRGVQPDQGEQRRPRRRSPRGRRPRRTRTRRSASPASTSAPAPRRPAKSRPTTSTTRPPSTSPPISGSPTTGSRRSAARTTAPGRTATASSTRPRSATRTWCTPSSTAPSGSPTTPTRSPPATSTSCAALVDGRAVH